MNSTDKWDDRFVDLASHVATWSKDSGAKVGAVITYNNRVISTGFNGFPRGVLDRQYDYKEDKNLRTVHAEINAILFAKTDLTGHTLYCTHYPCAQCAAAIIQSGIKWVICPGITQSDISAPWRHSMKIAEEMFIQAKVTVLSVPTP